MSRWCITCSSIDHSWKDDTFVTCSSVISVWSPERQEPIHKFSYQSENLLKAKFNPAEVGLLAATSNERGILLYDVLMLCGCYLDSSGVDSAQGPVEHGVERYCLESSRTHEFYGGTMSEWSPV